MLFTILKSCIYHLATIVRDMDAQKVSVTLP